MKKLIEGRTEFWTYTAEEVSKDMPVFYNPVMKLNRDLSILMISALDWKDNLRLCFPMEATGVRVARVLNEIDTKNISTINVNDSSEEAVKLIKKNCKSPKITITEQDANSLLRERRVWDYIDIDPFGTPNPFLDSAVRRTARDGILAVTATDTSGLTGTYPRVTRRKYWAEPSRTWVMHEIGLRILIRKVQLIGAQYDKALFPILSISTDHYYRVFFRVDRSQSAVKPLLKQHKQFIVDHNSQTCTETDLNTGVGPLWAGPLHDKKIISKMIKIGKQLELNEAVTLLTTILEECSIETVGFVDIHQFSKISKVHGLKKEDFFRILGKDAVKTHISPIGIKTKLTVEEILKRVQRHAP